jgi:glycosyltransferase involved in cell wall biosynthesis
MVRTLAEQLAASRPGLEFILTEWSLAATWRALERCDFVLLPHEWRNPWVHGKSHNRLVAAIAAGRLALASPIPSYLELKDYAWVEDDLAGGIAWAVLNPEEARERVARGQAHVERNFSPAAIAEKWAQALGRSVSNRSPR